MQGNGYVEVSREADGFMVHDWSEHHDSGYHVGTFARLVDALAAAHDWKAKNPHRRLTVFGEELADDE